MCIDMKLEQQLPVWRQLFVEDPQGLTCVCQVGGANELLMRLEAPLSGRMEADKCILKGNLIEKWTLQLGI